MFVNLTVFRQSAILPNSPDSYFSLTHLTAAWLRQSLAFVASGSDLPHSGLSSLRPAHPDLLSPYH